YPRSFQDSNADGIGDLAGIIARLEHVAALGVDAIWISPFFRSPMLDFGYDVSDYCDVDPMFGSLADFDALIARAHELGIRILIDLVISHSSNQHVWFQESQHSRTNPKADWYVWADAKPDGSPPNNWLSIFGGPAWEWSGDRMQYYLHNFLKEQPDLNLHNADVQDALLDVARFWLERGVDGFRLDTINFYFHDKLLRDNPPLPPEARNTTIAPEVNPYNWQDHLHDKNQPENLAFLQRLRVLMNAYPGTTAVGEVGDAQRGMEIQAEYTSGGDKVHMCYSFEFLSGTTPDAAKVAEVLTAYEDLQDPYGIRFWPKFKGRDGCRTPMPWTTDNHNGGFSEARPWLPVAVEHLPRAVGAQAGQAGSMLDFYRRMIGFRQAWAPLIKGDLSHISAVDGVLSFRRTYEGQVLFCAFNMTDDVRRVPMPEGKWRQDRGAPFAPAAEDGAVFNLMPYHAVFAAAEDAPGAT
ncbi:alpha-amylase family glycosyl hydrolase, partial [Roseicyclus sp.]|uniref:alpha-amylase family glycosyl hydrolase n=1 Tax=Roseicyclus sp. TaxID=1914329 RepID=UPI004053FFD3